MAVIDDKVKFPDVHVRLSGEDGNAALIIGRIGLALRRAGYPVAEAEFFAAAHASPDYDSLLQLCMTWVDVT